MKSLVPLHISLDTGDYKIPVGLYGVGDWTNDVKVDKVHVSLEELIHGPTVNEDEGK